MSISYCYETSNSGLLKKGVQFVIDCPVQGLEVSGIGDIKDFLDWITPSLFSNVRGDHLFENSEIIGYTHTLHKFRINLGPSNYIGVRVVIKGKSIVRVLYTIPINSNVDMRIKISRYQAFSEIVRESCKSLKSGLPPGQVYVDIPVVYAILGLPEIKISSWVLRVEGKVSNPLELSLSDLYEIGLISIRTDFHCVTGWSLKEIEFSGVALSRLINAAKPLETANWVYVECADGYSTIIPLEEVMDSNGLLALEMNGKPLDPLHGYPARLLIPHLYGWKSAKWVTKLIIIDEYREGYWEALGYHPRGRVWLEERFKSN